MYEAPRNRTTWKNPSPTESREDSPPSRGEELFEVSVEKNLIHSGVQLYKEGDYSAAFDAFDSALKNHSLEDDNMVVATILGNLGPVYLQLGKLDEAERSLIASLEMKRRLDPHLSVADTLSNLGTCANMKRDYDASLEHYRAALQDLRANSGPRKDMANALFNLGRLLVQKGEWDTAMGVLRESVRVQREVYGENHIYVAQALELVGYAQLSTEAYDSALLSFTGALAVYRRINGPLDGSIANVLFNVGLVRERKNELADAWEAYATCRDLYRRLETPRDDKGYKAVRTSIAKVERLILQQRKAALDKEEPQDHQKRQHKQGRRTEKRQVQI